MYKLISLLIFLAFISCKSSQHDTNSQNKITVDDSDKIASKDSVSAVVNHLSYTDSLLMHNRDIIKGFSPDIIGFKKHLNDLDRKSLTSIAISKDYIADYLPTTIKISDSLYFAYLRFFYATVNSFNDTLYDTHADLIQKLERGLKDSETIDFNDFLDFCGLELLMSEGYFYVDSKPDFFYDLFKGRLSPSMSEYLMIRRKEIKQGFSEDAGMLISFTQLAERVKTWEDYRIKYPDAYNHGEADYYYQIYFETFMTGMDNSRVFDLIDYGILPEVKELYQEYINDNPDRESAIIIKDYYDFLSRHDFIYNDSIDIFLESYNLSSMLGVQPHLR